MKPAPAARPRRRNAAAVALCLALAAFGFLGRANAADPEVTDAAVDAAIQRAVQRVRAARNPAGHWEQGDNPNQQYWAGTTGLAVLALLYAGVPAHDAELQPSIDWLAEQKLEYTYTRAVRAQVLALLPARRHTVQLQDDVDWLVKAAGPRGSRMAGAYDYTPIQGEVARWDNSNSQFGVLGVWMAADAGVRVPESYWELVAEHWLDCHNPDGGWGYQQNAESTATMTAAGVGSLLMVLDQRYFGQKEAGPLVSATERGLRWLGGRFSRDDIAGQTWSYYYLYGVERTGRASGYKYFGEQDWFRTGAAFLLTAQNAEGGWGSGGATADETELRNTAFALLFLCHGRAPLLFNKLQHGPDWNVRLRDLENVARFASRAFERLLNWQIIRLDNPLEDLLEAPVLYLYGESKWSFSDVEIQKIREYCARGGLVLAVGGKPDEFRPTFEELAARAFPEYPARPMRAGHPLITGAVQFEIKDPPPMLEVHNGVRSLMLFVGRDLASAWNRPMTPGRAAEFQLAGNIYLYATDKATFRSRLQTPAIAKRPTEIRQTIKLARIKYSGHWDVEPAGWSRLEAYLNNEAGVRLLVSAPVSLNAPELTEFPVAHITGTAAFDLSPEELAALRQYLSGGGTLLADAAGGSPAFIEALERHLRAATLTEPKALPPDAAILTGAGIPGAIDLAGVAYRRTARSVARGEKYPRLMAIRSPRRYSVLYSPLDLSAGLLGTPVYNLQSYEAEGVLQIMRNLILYAGLPAAERAGLERVESE